VSVQRRIYDNDTPPEIGNLTNLTELAIGGNQISDITGIKNLTNLTEIYLWGNPITEIPIEIAHFKNLRILYLPDLKLDKQKFTDFLKSCTKPV